MPIGAVAARFDALQLVLERPLGRGLQVHVERGEHLEPLLVELLAELVLELLPDELHEIGRNITSLGLAGELERVRLGQAGVRVADASLGSHELDDGIPPLNGALRKATRVVALGRLGQAGEHGGLRKVEILGRLTEVPLCRRLHAE